MDIMGALRHLLQFAAAQQLCHLLDRQTVKDCSLPLGLVKSGFSVVNDFRYKRIRVGCEMRHTLRNLLHAPINRLKDRERIRRCAAVFALTGDNGCG